jgi:transcriptional regulator with XRE-family HTH domain
MALDGPIGERIRIYRLRRGLSQKELAGLVRRSESWLSQVERGIRSVDKLSVLIDIAKVLKVKVETLSGQPFSLAPNGEPELDDMVAIQRALSSYPGLGITSSPTSKLLDIERLTTEVHLRYQAADYRAAARTLPALITSVDTLVAEMQHTERRRALELQCSVYVATAKLVTKVGDGELAWLTADRAVSAALHAESPTLEAAAAYQVACAFLKNDRLDEAETIAMTTAANLRDDSPSGVSLRGALTLIGAVIAGRQNNRGDATERLHSAQALADQLGEDGNYGWTAFGPTNVAIHRVSTAAELGDATEAIAKAENVDVSSLPEGLLSRRAQVHIDMAWAHTQRRADTAAVVNLLEAERVAPQTLRYNVLVRELLREMLKRERRTATPGLRALAQRAGVLR